VRVQATECPNVGANPGRDGPYHALICRGVKGELLSAEDSPKSHALQFVLFLFFRTKAAMLCQTEPFTEADTHQETHRSNPHCKRSQP
jgi:hypothetical protein